MAGRSSSVISVLITGDAKPLRNAVSSAGSSLADFGKKAGIAMAAVGAAVGAAAFAIGKDAVGAASDLNEELSKSQVIFGDVAGQVEEFARGAATALGQTTTQALGAASTFAIFGKGAGLAGQDLADFSTDFVTLASDLASFNNTTPEDAIQAIGAALRGESEPIRRYGVLLDDATLRQKALELGITDTIKNSLTPQQRVLAAQAAIMEQTTDAQGDFARTSDGLANKQRILAAQLGTIKTTIGEALLPVVLTLATAFSDHVLPVLTNFADRFREMEPQITAFGQTVLTPIIDFFRTFGTVAGETGATLMTQLEPFIAAVEIAFRNAWYIVQDLTRYFIDEVLPVITDLAIWFGNNLAPVIDTVSAAFVDYLLPAFKGIVDFIMEKVVPTVKNVLEPVFEAVVDVVNTITSAIDDNKDKFLEFYDRIEPVVDFIRDTVAPIFGEVLAGAFRFVGDIISELIEFVADLLDFLGRAVEKVVEFARAVADSPVGTAVGAIIDGLFGRAAGGAVMAGTPYLVGERGPELFVPRVAGDIIPNGRLGGGGVTNIQVTVTSADPEAVVQAIRRYTRHNGPLGQVVTL